MEILRGIFLKRQNRFVVECLINNSHSLAYLPNPGRLLEILFPGTTIYLHPASKNKKLPYVVYGALKDERIVMLHTHYTNRIARKLIEENRIKGLQGYRVVSEEVSYGKSRLDFLLKKKNHELYLEVKSCTLFHKGIAMFPDAPTQRGKKHLHELSKTNRAAVLFIIHNPDVRLFVPDYHTDLEFARTLYSLKHKIKTYAVSIGWNDSMEISTKPVEVRVGLEMLDKELEDSGLYVYVLRLDRELMAEIGSLGKIRFPPGYYIYTGSAQKGLSKRLNRHKRKRKKLHWHIDHLSQHAQAVHGFAIRAAETDECNLAAAIRRISDWQIMGFGSTDCGCEGHLFGMAENPMHFKPFISTVLDFRVQGLLNKSKI